MCCGSTLKVGLVVYRKAIYFYRGSRGNSWLGDRLVSHLLFNFYHTDFSRIFFTIFVDNYAVFFSVNYLIVINNYNRYNRSFSNIKLILLMKSGCVHINFSFSEMVNFIRYISTNQNLFIRVLFFNQGFLL